MDSAKNTPEVSDDIAASGNDIVKNDDHIFQTELENLLQKSEEFRLEKMTEHRGREFMALSITLASVVLGAGGFAWYLLVMGNFLLALGCMFLAVLPHLFLASWVREPIRTYKEEYKKEFMPKLAKILGGLNFYPKRGISRKILSKTAIVPAHDNYTAEDCFAGKYKGAKITFSEATLTKKNNKGASVFEGIFVLIELGRDVFQGHSVITADGQLAKRLMKRFKRTPISHTPYDSQFTLLSTEENYKILDDGQLLKELSETVALFKKSPVSAAFFAKKYIFMMIPCEEDMFEASDMYIPVTNNEAALRCKREVEQLMSIIDIVGVYQDGAQPASAPATPTPPAAPPPPATPAAEEPAATEPPQEEPKSPPEE